MFQIKKAKATNLDDLANLHWNNLIRKKSKFSKGSLPYEMDSIIRRIENIKTESNGKQLLFLNALTANNFKLLEKIIVSKPLELQKIGNQISKKISDNIFPNLIYRSKKTDRKQFGDYVSDIFNYDSFVDKERFWNAYELSSRLGIDVCMYCNRNYTYTITKGKEYYVRPEFDHFLPKSKYPFFAISFYNLIPSCHICNSNLKRDNDFSTSTNLHPYINSIDDILKFTVEFNDKKIYTSKGVQKSYGVMFFMDKIDNFSIKLVSRNHSKANSLNKKALNNCNVFKLNELYNCSKDLVTEMVLNTIIYNDSRINELFKDFGGTLFHSKDDIIRHITKNYHLDSDMPKRPFSKLVKDIHKEFGLKY